MKKIALTLVLATLLLFSGQAAFAKLQTPTGLQNIAVGEGSAKVGWNWSEGGGTIVRFVISYRVAGEGGEWAKRYPSASVREYTIMGLTENTTYEWRIMAEADQPSQNSDESPAPPFTTLSGGGAPPPPGGGTPPPGGGTPVDLPRPIAAENLDQLFSSIFSFLFVLSMSVGVLMVVYAAFQMLTAQGDARKISQAKTIILWTVIALTIITLARGAPSIVKGLLGG